MRHGVVGTLRNLWNGAKSLWACAKGWLGRKEKTASACGCFAAATLVWTTAGAVPIDQVDKGDLVLAMDESSGTLEFREVTDTIVTPGAALLKLTIRHADGHDETLDTTDEHPFWVTKRETQLGQDGSTLKGEPSAKPPADGRATWHMADTLTPGDVLLALSGPAVVQSLLFTSERQTVHNLTVEGLHSFHVGADGVLVHNAACEIVQHHMFPAFRQNPAKRQFFERAGINPDDWTLAVPAEINRRIHPQWNRDWEAFMNANPNATGLDIWSHMYSMWNRYELPPGTLERYARSTR